MVDAIERALVASMRGMHGASRERGGVQKDGRCRVREWVLAHPPPQVRRGAGSWQIVSGVLGKWSVAPPQRQGH